MHQPLLCFRAPTGCKIEVIKYGEFITHFKRPVPKEVGRNVGLRESREIYVRLRVVIASIEQKANGVLNHAY